MYTRVTESACGVGFRFLMSFVGQDMAQTLSYFLEELLKTIDMNLRSHYF